MDSILSASQREFIRVDTMIDRAIIDRCVTAFDMLVDHDDLDTYKSEMMAVAIMVGDAPRPTAMDVMKTIIVKAYSDRWSCTFNQARKRILRAMKEDR